MTENDLRYLLAFARIPGLGQKALLNILEIFPVLNDLFQQDDSFLNSAGFSFSQRQAILNPAWQTIDSEINWCQQPQQHILTWFDESYPVQLKQIPDAPLLLYVHGDLTVLQQRQIAMVGSRNPTTQGLSLAEQFAYELAANNFVITSGLALGIDAASHRGAMAAKGKTIAVLGTGVNVIYPSKHHELAKRIVEQGALVSEFFLNTGAYGTNFPRRNRIISGLAQGVLVVEAALKSGSLITARNAAEQGRDVFAIPGSIHNPLAKGCHQLIRQGAKIIDCVADLIEEITPELDLQRKEPNIIKRKQSENDDKTLHVVLDEEQKHLLKCIGFGTLTVDDIVRISSLPTATVISQLLALELANVVSHTAGGFQLKSQKFRSRE